MIVVLGYSIGARHNQANVTALVKIISISILPLVLLSEWSSVVSMPPCYHTVNGLASPFHSPNDTRPTFGESNKTPPV